MDPHIKLWFNKGRQLAPPIVNWFAACMYLGVIGVYIYYTLTDFYRFPLPWLGVTALIFGVLILVALDHLEYKGQAQGEPSRLTVAVLQLLRAVVIVVFSLSDGLGLMHMPNIFLVIFLFFFFLCGRSYGLTSLGWVIYMILRVHLYTYCYNDPTWYDKSDDITPGLIYFLTLVFFLTIAYQAKLERANRLRVEKLLSELEVSHRQLHEYVEKVAELATIEERNRLARDIHDCLGHYLTVINVQLEKAMAFRNRNPQEADQAVNNAKRLAGEALQDIRRSVGTLRNTQETFSLVQALTGLVNNLQSSQLSIELEVDGCEKGFSQQSLMTLYRAAQEGLTNIQKHAQASHVTMSLKFYEKEASLYIADNGQGFDTGMLGKNETHYGLKGVQERLELIQGSIKLESAPGQGTKLLITVPGNPVPDGGI
ncbi:MAG: sensor histidine kinase [Firmicutes bacterium]|nr:sensor histidine kinase [Bacillota bacterium]